MSTSRPATARLLAICALVFALASTMFAGSLVSPNPSHASAVVSAERAGNAADWARTREGSRYRYGATGPRSFDCSGLTRWAYQRVGKSLPHSSAAQARRVKRVSHDNARRGDLVFFYGGGGVYHVAIYAGHNRIWHASRPGIPVGRDRIWTSRVFFGRVR